MTNLPDLIPAALARPLAWALIHFLWQGAAVAALLILVLRALAPEAARARYGAAWTALLVLAACPVLTLVVQPGVPDWTRPLRNAVSARFEMRVPLVSGSNGPATRPWRPRAGRLAASLGASEAAAEEQRPAPDAWLCAIVPIWLLGVLTLALRLAGGCLAVRRLARRAVPPSDETLLHPVTDLARRLGVREPVALRESAATTAPAVVGWRRPVILLPARALPGLPREQWEALLAHELAHVRRHDYPANLLQAAVEALLFHHPAVWWVSRTIRQERENCCDDLAVSVVGSRLIYGRALAALEALRAVSPPLLLAGDGGHLLARVRRFLGLPYEQARPTWGWLGGTMVIPLLLTTVALLQAAPADEPVRLKNEARPVVRNTAPAIVRPAARLQTPSPGPGGVNRGAVLPVPSPDTGLPASSRPPAGGAGPL